MNDVTCDGGFWVQSHEYSVLSRLSWDWVMSTSVEMTGNDYLVDWHARHVCLLFRDYMT